MTETDHKEEIRRRAYWIWKEEGAPLGEELRHWTMAEAEFEASKEGAVGDSVTVTTPILERSTGNSPARKKIKRTEGS